MSLIYKIVNDVNGKIYIGKTENTEEIRFKQHIRDSKKSRCEKRPLYDAMNKYGVENFHIEKIETCENDEIACIREQYWINKLRTYVGFNDCNGYNATLGGDSKKYKIYNIEDIIEMYNKTHDIKLISSTFNIERSYVSSLLRSNGIKVLYKSELYKEIGKYEIYQVELNTSNIINIFKDCGDANLYLGKKKNSSNIRDAIRGRRNNHHAFGFDWYRKKEYIEKFG